MKSTGTLCAAAAAIGLIVSASAAAQSATTGAIAGVARDTTGAVLPGVTVEASSAALIEKVRLAVSDDQGNYKIVDLRPGTYTVTFTLPGFATFRREGLELTTGFTATANADMRVGALEETVTVTGASPIVDVQNVRAQSVLSRQVLDSVPTGKTIQGYATLTLGATVGGAQGAADVGGNKGEASTSISIHGGRDQDLKLLQDGMRTNNSQGQNGGGVRWYLVNQAAVQEVTLETGGMSAESETGGVQLNAVPKEGGNSFKVYVNTSGTSGGLQNSNLSDDLRARGVSTIVKVKKVYDFGAGLGGPIKRDRVWFYTAHRWWGAQEIAPGNYYNKTPHGLTYTPDLDRPAYTDIYNQDHSVRVTWQVSRKDKVALSASTQNNCNCFYQVDVARAPEATRLYRYFPKLYQGTWSRPQTSRILFEAGLSIMPNLQDIYRPPESSPDDIGVTELSTGYRFNASAEGVGAIAYGTGDRSDQNNGRASVSYVTGSHAFKTGFFWQTGVTKIFASVNRDISYGFRFGVPVQLTQWATPHQSETRLRDNIGLYAQDQWTLHKLTLNLGLRFDAVNSYNPAQHFPGGQFVQAFDFAEVTNVPNWKDVSPRLGAAYDVFGNGKTAIKGYIGRYMGGQATAISGATNPANSMVTSATRTWTDANANFVPDCDLKNVGVNGECGALNNARFGTVNVVTRYSPDYTIGWGNRDYNWQGSLSFQQELRPGVAVNAGYFRTWFGNFTAADNLAVTAADFDQYCITAPADARLPGGGGNVLCGLYDVRPALFGQVNNRVGLASLFGQQTEVFNGLDVSLSARFSKGGQVAGGVSTGRTVTDNCFVVDSPQQNRDGFCHISPPWSARTQIKASGVYPLPAKFEVSGTLQNLPGTPWLATLVVPNAAIAPSLGRNLAAGANGTASVDLLPANSRFEKRLTQVDVRLTKSLSIGRTRLQGMFDVYNLFNANTVLRVNTAYGPSWLQPTSILGARLVKFGGQFDF